jgi:hypothetical protein
MPPLLKQHWQQRAITLVKMVAGKNLFFTIIYTSCLIICASLKEIRPIVNEELMPQDLVDICMDGRIDRLTRATLYASNFVGA